MGCILWLYLLLLFHLHFLATCSSSSTQLRSHDQSVALLQFKNSFSIDSIASSDCEENGIVSYPKTDSWVESTDCCSWDGVTCESATGHVIGLDLSCSRLSGNFPPNSSLFLLPHLESLNLASNHFWSSRISTHFGWFANLRHLNLSNSVFSGQVPSQISHLSRLISLDLSSYYGELRIETPTLKRMVQNLTEVRQLFLDSINMSSVAPSSLMNLSSSLTSLSLSDCQLRGNFPVNVFYLPKLQSFRLSYNSNLTGYFPKSNWSGPLELLDVSTTLFSGELPDSIGNLESLKYLSLYWCNFTGSIPSSLKNLKQLTNLDLGRNNFTGPIPDVFVSLIKLVSLYLNMNNFGGQLPSSVFNLSQLERVSFSRNQLVGSIPYQVGRLPNLSYLTLYANLLNGTIPSWVYTLPSLQVIMLSNNKLTGHIKEFRSRSLTYIDLASNKLDGPLPISIYEQVNVTYLSLSHNILTGELSYLICNVNSLKILDISHNNLSGVIPPCVGNLSESLSVLNLQKNNFHDTINVKFSKSCRLENLNLNGNHLGGLLPRSLVNCRNLEVVDFGNNKIDDKFPYWLGSLPELQVLVLHSNKFHGNIQNSKVNHSFPKLKIFDLSNNDFEGPLPTDFIKNLNAMMNVSDGKSDLQYMSAENYSYDYSVTVTMKNFEIELVKILTIFTSIDLSKNKFEGEIPEAIGMLNSLKGLNFSHNMLTGDIPPSMGKLISLEWLDLSTNKLVGEIPRQLVDLTFLSFLNLSQNQLVGSIPREKQFNTFENDSFVGNLGLCGIPLSKTCKNDEAQQPPPSTFQEEDDSESSNEFGWKVVLIGYGCGMIFGLAMGYLVFHTRKPKWFVTLVEGKQHQKAKRSKRNSRRTDGRRN